LTYALNSGQNAVAVQAGLIADLGGAENISTAQKILIELVGRELYYLDETDQRIVRCCRIVPKLKTSPKGMALLYSYRVPIIANLMALGWTKNHHRQKPSMRSSARSQTVTNSVTYEPRPKGQQLKRDQRDRKRKEKNKAEPKE
jgi:hypothetical protein